MFNIFNNPTFFYRAATFFFYLFSALFLNAILKNISEIDDESRFFITIFFSILPVNFARISFACVPYALCYFLFFFSVWLISQYMNSKKIYFRFFPLILFFLSFFTNSLIAFYILVIFFIFYLEKNKNPFFKSNLMSFIKYFDFILLPFVFFLLKNEFFKPNGLYAGYNEFKIKDIIINPLPLKSILDSVYYSIFNVLKLDAISIVNLFIMILIIYMLNLILKREKKKEPININDFYIFLFGIMIFLFSIYPYLVVNLIPQLGDWESRHQLLTPLGISMILCYGIKIVSNIFSLKELTRKFLLFSVIVFFILLNNKNYLGYWIDWFKQESLIENIKTSEVIKENTTFIFSDFVDLNAHGRRYRFYEYTGLMKYAFGDERRFGEDNDAFKNMDIYRLYEKATSIGRYNITDYKFVNPQYNVFIKPGDLILKEKGKITIKTIFRSAQLFILKIFNPKIYKENVKKILSLEYQKIR